LVEHIFISIFALSFENGENGLDGGENPMMGDDGGWASNPVEKTAMSGETPVG